MALLPEGGLEQHRQPYCTERKLIRRKSLAMLAVVGPGHGGKTARQVEVRVDIEGIVGLVKGAEARLATVAAPILCFVPDTQHSVQTHLLSAPDNGVNFCIMSKPSDGRRKAAHQPGVYGVYIPIGARFAS